MANTRRYVIDFSDRYETNDYKAGGGGTDAVIANSAPEALLVAALENFFVHQQKPGRELGTVHFQERIAAQFVSDDSVREAFDEARDNEGGALTLISLDAAKHGDRILLSAEVRRVKQD